MLSILWNGINTPMDKETEPGVAPHEIRDEAASPDMVDCCCPDAADVIPRMISKANVNLTIVVFFFNCSVLTRNEPIISGNVFWRAMFSPYVLF